MRGGAAFGALLAALAPPAAGQAEVPRRPVPPRLVVVLAVDQLRADYLQRFAPWFGEDGFKRILREGAHASNARYDHGITHTGPGHAVIATGASPNRTGIVANAWLDRETLAEVYCAGGALGISPETNAVASLGDRWKQTFGAKSKVVCFSFKDRAAGLLGGHHADVVAWFDQTHAIFTTSAYYAQKRELAAGADRAVRFFLRLNGTPDQLRRKKRYVDAWRGETWSLLVPPGGAGRGLYGRLPPDDRPGELPPIGMTGRFPHVVKDDDLYGALLVCSPYGNEFLLGVADRAVQSLALGRGGPPDLLLVSLSSLDYVGHAFGPYSYEVADTVLRLDRQLARFMKQLDTRVGKGRWTLAVASDHGVGPLPSYAKERFGDGERIDPDRISKNRDEEGFAVRLSRHLAQAFQDRLPSGFRPIRVAGEGKARVVQHALFVIHNYMIYFRPAVLAKHGLDAAELARETVLWARLQGELECAFTAAELTSEKLPAHRYARLYANSFYRRRSGDVVFCTKPHLLPFSWSESAATHGTAHDYDRRVPLLLIGKGIRRGAVAERPIRVVDLPATLGALAGVTLAPEATGRAIEELLLKPKGRPRR